jgi:hypothetical protein
LLGTARSLNAQSRKLVRVASRERPFKKVGGFPLLPIPWRRLSILGRQPQDLEHLFEVFLQASRADRQRMEQQAQTHAVELQATRKPWPQQALTHEPSQRTFRETIQAMLAESTRIQQRLAG